MKKQEPTSVRFDEIAVVEDRGERTVAIDGRPMDLDLVSTLALAHQAHHLRRIAEALEKLVERGR